MPIYEYRAVNPEAACERCRVTFEVRQSIHDPALAKCPECGQAVERLISRCGISTTQSTKAMLSDKNLKAKGFTKLVNEGGGKFRKVT
jgi:putative FmdB family regulatory protein